MCHVYLMYLWYTLHILIIVFFFFNDTATTEIYTLSLHDALPIFFGVALGARIKQIEGIPYLEYILPGVALMNLVTGSQMNSSRSEEHTSELQSRQYLVCRLLLEKKKKITLR